jgi:hypothetical protein
VSLSPRSEASQCSAIRALVLASRSTALFMGDPPFPG